MFFLLLELIPMPTFPGSRINRKFPIRSGNRLLEVQNSPSGLITLFLNFPQMKSWAGAGISRPILAKKKYLEGSFAVWFSSPFENSLILIQNRTELELLWLQYLLSLTVMTRVCRRLSTSTPSAIVSPTIISVFCTGQFELGYMSGGWYLQLSYISVSGSQSQKSRIRYWGCG